MIRLTAATLEVEGAVTADGALGTRWSGSGAGGSIVLRTATLSGSGALHSRGPQVPDFAGGGGGGGLILVAAASSTFTGTASAIGGLGESPGEYGLVTWTDAGVAPAIESLPPRTARVGQRYAYAALATGGPPLEWTLEAGPPGASVDRTSGSVDWLPAHEGTERFTLAATSPFGTARQEFEVHALAADAEAGAVGAPRFVSTPDTAARCGVPYRYSGARTPVVTGPGGPVRFELGSLHGLPLPPALSVDPDTGELSWTPTPSDEGAHPLELRALGPAGVARQTFAVVVECPTRVAVGCGCSQSPAAADDASKRGERPPASSQPSQTASLAALALVVLAARSQSRRPAR